MKSRPWCFGLVGALLLAAVLPCLAAESVAARLSALSREHGFRVDGIERLRDTPAPRTTGDLSATLRVLLGDYDYVLEGPAMSPHRVIIVGVRRPAPSGMVVQTRRQRSHHVVDARLTGPSRRPAPASMIVDTGASSVVLPMSMMATLGFEAESLPDATSQTVNGPVTGKSARLARVSVNAAVAEDVAVLFVPDDRLGGVSLLGMSFLDRFTVTLDETRDRLLLAPR